MEDNGAVHGVRVRKMPVWYMGESVVDVGIADGVRVWRMLVLYTG